jgi:DNA-3-methyladenine glycosylase I
MTIKRCDWVGTGKPFYEHYHDTEWGVPVHDDIASCFRYKAVI